MIYLSLSIDFESLRSKIANGKASVIYTIAVILSSGRAFRWVGDLFLFNVSIVIIFISRCTSSTSRHFTSCGFHNYKYLLLTHTGKLYVVTYISLMI